MPFRNWAKNLLFLLVYIFSGLALVIIIDGLLTGGELTPFNTAVEVVMIHIRTPFLTSIMITVTNLASPFMLSIFSILLAILIVIRRDTYDTLLFIVSISLSLVSFTVLKNALHLARPVTSLVTVGGWTFPSGHATVATAFFFTVAYSFIDRFKSVFWKVTLVAGCIVGAGLVSISRVYLGAHFALDVLAGIVLGLCTVSFVVLVFNIFLEEKGTSLRKKLEHRGVL